MTSSTPDKRLARPTIASGARVRVVAVLQRWRGEDVPAPRTPSMIARAAEIAEIRPVRLAAARPAARVTDQGAMVVDELAVKGAIEWRRGA